MKIFILTLFLALLIGCAPLTEAQKYERQDRETLRTEKYYRDKKACTNGGGMIEIGRRGHVPYDCMTGRKDCPPRLGEFYLCVRRF